MVYVIRYEAARHINGGDTLSVDSFTFTSERSLRVIVQDIRDHEGFFAPEGQLWIPLHRILLVEQQPEH